VYIDRIRMESEGWTYVKSRQRLVHSEEILKKRIKSESIQLLIRARLQQQIHQEQADVLCGFVPNTFKHIESNRYLPTDIQLSCIEEQFHVRLEIVTIS
jgi:hypothetical protein